jgi:prophage regulatory protein
MTTAASIPDLNMILRLPEVRAATGLSCATIYRRIGMGLLTKPIHLGARAVGWPAREVAALNRARIAGKSNEEVRALVSMLLTARLTPDVDA